MNNAVYGQTLMDVTKFSDFELVNSQTRYHWLQRKYYRIRNEIIYSQCKKCQERDSLCHDCDADENCFVGIEKNKHTVCFNRPIYVGFQILELSKLHMYKFWYDVLRAKYGDKICLLMTDTDNLIFQIFCEDLDKTLLKMTDSFDFSNYDQNHPLYSSISKKNPWIYEK